MPIKGYSIWIVVIVLFMYGIASFIEGLVNVLVISSLFIFVYFLPTIVGYFIKHKKLGEIFVVNLLLGWTLIGWLYTYIWSLKKS